MTYCRYLDTLQKNCNNRQLARNKIIRERYIATSPATYGKEVTPKAVSSSDDSGMVSAATSPETNGMEINPIAAVSSSDDHGMVSAATSPADNGVEVTPKAVAS